MGALDMSPFTDFYAVVLDHRFGGPLRWSPHHGAWLRSLTTSQWASEPVDGDEVLEGQVEAALTAAETFRQDFACRRCGALALAETHFIAIDVFAEPVVYCVQRPATEVVGSRGGTGSKKHWGSPLGCTAVRPVDVTGTVPGLGRRDVLGIHIYSEPLIADKVLLLPWCSRCRSEAQAWKAGAPRNEEEMLRAHDARIRQAARSMLDWVTT